MKIERLGFEKFDEFIDFHSHVYPHHYNYQNRFQFQFINNPYLQDKKNPYILLAIDNNEIIGQYGVNQFSYRVAGQEIPCYCGCDLYVYERYRKYGVGGLLSVKAINSYKPHISIGISPEARPLLESLRMKVLGEMHLFVWTRTPLSAFKGLLSFIRKPRHKFYHEDIHNDVLLQVPSTVSSNGWTFQQTRQEFSYYPPTGTNAIFEFSRNEDFMKWRFFLRSGYYLYRVDTTSLTSYFVLKKIFWRNMVLLALLDYRSTIDDVPLLRAMIKAVKKIAKDTQCDGILTMSSHQFFDNGFKKENFWKIGSPFEIMTNTNLPFDSHTIQSRNSSIITMVDSDLEFAFGF